MQGQGEAAFSLCGEFEANPHTPDYWHRLRFSPAGTVEMHDAAGHLVLSRVRGRFTIQPIDACSVQVHLYDLVELGLGRSDEPMRELEPWSVKVTREEGVYAFRHPSGPMGASPAAWPCLLYWNRYFFEVDPLLGLPGLARNRQGSAYLAVMEEPDTRCYYRLEDVDHDMLTVADLADLADLGVALQPVARSKEGFQDKIVLGYRLL